MKKILLTATLLATTTLLFSQTKFGVKAGVNFANQEFKAEGISVSANSLTSFHVLGLVDYQVSPIISLQPGLGLSGKGFKLDAVGVDAKVNLLYLDIPVNAVAKFPIPNFGKFFIGAGPYAAIGISGKAKGDESVETDDVNLFSEDGAYKTGDFGFNFLGGIELAKGFTLNANYGLGLTNISRDTEDGTSVKNKVFSISVGFLF